MAPFFFTPLKIYQDRCDIKECVDLDVPIRTVGDYLKRWGFTPQKPIRSAYQRNKKHVQRWLAEEFPKTKRRAKAEEPSYSPDLNPDEYLDRDLKSNLNNKPLGRAKGEIEVHAKEHMEMVEQQAEKIKKLFDAKTVKYAS